MKMKGSGRIKQTTSFTN